MYFTKTIRGTKVEIFAEDWDGDEAVGIPRIPHHVYAIDENGKDFPLTETEIEEITTDTVAAEANDTDPFLTL